MTEMLRVCKSGGLVITLNPYAKAFIYRWAKSIAQKNGRWSAGYEKPLRTLKPIAKRINNSQFVKEFSRGFLFQLYFLKYLFNFPPLIRSYSLLNELINKTLMFFNNFSGYLLVTVLRRK